MSEDGSPRKLSEEQCNRLFSLSLDILGIITLDGHVEAMNLAVEHTLGFTVPEVASRPLIDFVHPEDRDRTLGELQKLRSGIATVYFENRQRCKDGSYKWIAWTAVPDPEEGLAYVVGRDVTRRKNAEEALRQKASEFEAVFQALPDLYFRLDAEGTYLDYKAMRVADLYAAPEEFLGKRMQDILPPSVTALLTEAIRQALDTNSTVTTEYSLPMPSGEQYYEIRISPLTQTEVVAVVRNVTDRKRLEEISRQRQERFQTIFTESSIGIELYDGDGRLLEANRACLAMFGVVDAAEIKGFNLFEDPNIPDEAKERLRRGEPATYVVSFDFYKVQEARLYQTTRSGVAYLDVTITPLGPAPGRAPTGYLAQVQDITERKLAEDALRASEASYRAIFDSANDAIFIQDVETGQILDVNRKMTEMYGVTVEEARQLSVEELSAGTPPYTQKDAMEWVRKAAKGAPQIVEWLAKRQDGHLFWVEVSLRQTNIWGKDRLLAIVRDITERKKAEEERNRLALEEGRRIEAEAARERIASILESITDGFFALDRRWRFTYVNSQAERLLQRSREDLIGRNLWEEFPLAKGSIFERQYQAAVARQRTVAFETFYPPLGIWVEVRAYPSRDGLSVYFRDISQRKEAGRERDRFAAILEATPDFVGMADPEGHNFYLNAAARAMLGIGKDQDIKGRMVSDNHPDWAIRIILDEGFPTAIEKGIWRGETAVLGPGGQEIPVSMVLLSHASPDGKVEYLSTISRDITERKRAEQFREQYSQTISHDLRAPLTIIIGQAQLIERYAERPSLVRSSASAIQSNGRRMNSMIQDLVDSARFEGGQLRLAKQPIEFSAFVTELIATAQGVLDFDRVKLDIPSDLPTISADPERLERILSNLLTNALKYSAPDSEVFLKARQTDGELIVSVTDRGIGIAPEDLPHLFERFYRARGARTAEGVGLGLYIAKILVEAHGGRIWVESIPRQTTAFHFTLPLRRAPELEG